MLHRALFRVGTMLEMISGALSRATVRAAHIANPGLLAIIAVGVLAAIQRLRQAAQKPQP